MNFLGIDWYAEANVLLTEAIATTWQNKRFKRTMALHMYYDKSPTARRAAKRGATM